ncbi:MAG: hypothetical protein K5Q68_00970, partial [Roseococcus sp.]|nr:hypothetical protein [Roseococcus sp.]
MPRSGPPAKGQKARKSNAKKRADDASPAPNKTGRAKVKTAPKGAALPSKADLKLFLISMGGRVGKSEIARHFGLHTEQRPALRQLLSEMKFEGSAKPVGKRTFAGEAAGAPVVAPSPIPGARFKPAAPSRALGKTDRGTPPDRNGPPARGRL